MKNIVRKTIKKEAKTKPKKNLAIALLLMTLIACIIIAITYFITNLIGYNYNIKVINDLIIGIILILMSPFVLGFAKMSKEICNNKETNPKEIFVNLKNLKYIKLFTILILGLIFITWLIGLIPGVGIFINMIILIFYIPFIIMMPFVYLENQRLPIKEIIFKTENIVSGNRIKFYGLLISFSLWIILSLVTLGLLSFYVIPYIYLSFALLYTHFTYERDFKREKSISDGNIILIFIGIIILLIAFLAINIPGSTTWFKAILTGEIEPEIGDTNLSYGGVQITFDAPKEYKANFATDTSKTYINDKNLNVLQYTIYLSDVSNAIEMDKEIVNEMRTSENYKNVKDDTFTLKVNGENIKCYKYTATNDDKQTSTVTAYYPKGDFIVAVSLSNNDGKELKEGDIKEFITVY